MIECFCCCLGLMVMWALEILHFSPFFLMISYRNSVLNVLPCFGESFAMVIEDLCKLENAYVNLISFNCKKIEKVSHLIKAMRIAALE